MYPETTIWNDLRIWYYNKGSVGQLILLNTLLFLITGTIGLVDFLFSLNIAPAVKLWLYLGFKLLSYQQIKEGRDSPVSPLPDIM